MDCSDAVSVPARGLVPITAMVAVLVACSPSQEEGTAGDSSEPAGSTSQAESTEPADGFDWKQASGTEIELLLNQHPWQIAIEPRIAEFEELTGITVNVTALPEDQMRQRVQVEMSSQSDAVDVYMSGALAEGRLFQQQGWYEDLTSYVEDPSSTTDDYDYDDFAPDVIGAHVIDDQLIGVPIQIETNMLFYRTDVLADLGLDVPTTTDEMRTVAENGGEPDRSLRVHCPGSRCCGDQPTHALPLWVRRGLERRRWEGRVQYRGGCRRLRVLR